MLLTLSGDLNEMREIPERTASHAGTRNSKARGREVPSVFGGQQGGWWAAVGSRGADEVGEGARARPNRFFQPGTPFSRGAPVWRTD